MIEPSVTAVGMRCLQIAFNGEWERAAIYPASPEGAARAASDIVECAAPECALELVFGSSTAPAFLGFRERERDVNNLARLLCNPELMGWTNLEGACTSAAIAYGKEILSPSRVARLELGVFNAWKRHGPHCLWSRGESSSTIDVEALLSGVADCHLASLTPTTPIVLEAAWSDPIEHWIGWSVSVQHRQGFEFSASQFRAAFLKMRELCLL